jgi:indole-3-glycerol phosphate synthase
VDLKVAEKLVPGVPKDKTIVVESGIQTHREISHFQELGAHAVLIGETFMRSPDIGPKIEELMHGR